MNFTHNEKSTGKNFTGITIVVLLHILVAWGIISGLGTRLVATMVAPVETKIIEEVAPPPPKELPPPPPPPEMKAPPPPFIPPVEVNVQQPPPPQNVLQNATNVAPPTKEIVKAPPAATAPPTPARSGPPNVAAVADFSTCALPEWPKSSLRNEETGTVTLSFLIAADGRVADSKIVKTSGFRDLDKAAVVGISKCKFKPGLTDGKPTEAWMQMQYVWKLE